MKFLRVDYPPDEDKKVRRTCYLVNNNWDDFGFKTSFQSFLFDDDGQRHELGYVKILQKGMKSGYVPLPNLFQELSQDWCSLGGGRDYYLVVAELPDRVRDDYLRGISDCVFNPAIYEAFSSEEGMRSSLLRDVSRRDVESSFPRILAGDSALTPYEFSFQFDAGGSAQEVCEFSVRPDSRPPTNIHVLIGRNGVGKTRLLAGMADALTDNAATTIGLNGRFEFNSAPFVRHESNTFLNLVVVSYSAFDRFDPITPSSVKRSETAIPYYYIGIKADAEPTERGASFSRATLKSSGEFESEFKRSLETVAKNPRKWKRWHAALETLCSDPGIFEFRERTFTDEVGWSDFARTGEQFHAASSGHKIVLLTITRLIEHVSDRSLVVIDEPETHLHPPLLGSFVRALSDLLVSQNGVAIVATHSPVVLQEVPAQCVCIIGRSGDRMRVHRPDIETFAENVGTLTRKVFGLEVDKSGFYRMLKDSAQGRDFQDVLLEFGEQVGSEGRALARVFTSEDQG